MRIVGAHLVGAHLNFQSDTLEMFEELVPVIITESGHYCITLSRSIVSPCAVRQQILS